MQNPLEADLVVQFVEALVRSGVDQDQVGIISLYRQQVKVLERRLANVRLGSAPPASAAGQRGCKSEEEDEIEEWEDGLDKVEVLTADKSQGRDKDCIVVSLVRSNAEKQVPSSPFHT